MLPSKIFFISALRNGLSEKPPTINMKVTGAYLSRAYCISSSTFAIILSKSGLKNDVMTAGGRSIEL
jgi:hypothetical protein